VSGPVSAVGFLLLSMEKSFFPEKGDSINTPTSLATVEEDEVFSQNLFLERVAGSMCEEEELSPLYLRRKISYRPQEGPEKPRFVPDQKGRTYLYSCAA